MQLAIQTPVATFYDVDGSPLDGGYLRFGAPNNNPTSAPVTVYWDAAGTQPALQPIRTRNGFPVNGTAQAVVFASGDYSLSVHSASGELVGYYPSAAAVSASAQVQAALNTFVGRLANPLSSSDGGAMVAIRRDRPNAVASTLRRDREDSSIKVLEYMTDAQRNDVRAGTALHDLTAAFQAAINDAYALGFSVVEAPDGLSRIDGTVSVLSGVTLAQSAAASEYYVASPYGTIKGACLYKPQTTGLNGPIVEMRTSSGLRGLYLWHDRLNGAVNGVIRMGIAGTQEVCYSCGIRDVRIYGRATADLSGANTCYGVYFPPSATPKQRYFNMFANVAVTNCDVAFRLNDQSNANIFTGILTRQCFVHWELDGGASQDNQCVDNVFSGLQVQNVGMLQGPTSIAFKLTRNCYFNVFSGYVTEHYGAAFSIDGTCTFNSFVGMENGATVESFVPVGNTHSRWSQPISRDQYSQLLLPNRTTGDRYIQGLGSKISRVDIVAGALPQLNGAGSLVAGNANCRTIVRFPALYAKANRISFIAQVSVFVGAAGGGAGEHITTVRFAYRVTDQATNAGQLSVLSIVDRKPSANYIAGLYFLTGVAAGLPFGIAMTGGNLGPVEASHIVVSTDITVLTHTTNSIPMAELSALSAASSNVSAADVTDAISLLTVADTAV